MSYNARPPLGPGRALPNRAAAVPPGRPVPPRRLVVLLLAVGGGAYAFNELGSFLAAEDPLQKSDAIFVLAGTRMTRALQAADPWFAGDAPRIVLSREVPDPAFDVLARKSKYHLRRSGFAF